MSLSTLYAELHKLKSSSVYIIKYIKRYSKALDVWAFSCSLLLGVKLYMSHREVSRNPIYSSVRMNRASNVYATIINATDKNECPNILAVF